MKSPFLRRAASPARQSPTARESPTAWVSPAAVRATAAELLPAGRMPGRAAADALVAELREDADTATDLVLSVMRPSSELDTRIRRRLGAGQTLVVDRLGWVEANAQTFSALLSELAAATGTPAPSAASRAAAAVEMGSALAVLGSRVLGQFDPFHRQGRLLLVAPNILTVEEQLQVPSRDFRLWVAVHERTHHVQSAAAPWLRAHLQERMNRFLAPAIGANPSTGANPATASGTEQAGQPAGEEPPAALQPRGFVETIGLIGEAIIGDTSLIDTVLGPTHAELLDEITALMSLLEGHADVVMDDVGPGVIPSVRRIRAAFEEHRHSATGIRALINRVLGLDEKLAQYTRGARFVRAVVARRGHAGLNRVWESPAHLPSLAEIARPEAWIARVLDAEAPAPEVSAPPEAPAAPEAPVASRQERP